MTSLHIVIIFFLFPFWELMASTKIQWNLWVCCNVLPGWWTGNCPSLSKRYCDVKTAARLFLESLITVAGGWAWKDKMLFLSKISKWNFTNVHSRPPRLLCCQQAAKKPAGFFQRLSFHEDFSGVGTERWDRRACKMGLNAMLEARLLYWEHTCCYANGTGLYFSI